MEPRPYTDTCPTCITLSSGRMLKQVTSHYKISCWRVLVSICHLQSVKRFALCCRTVVCLSVCLSCLSVTLVTTQRLCLVLSTNLALYKSLSVLYCIVFVYCGQTVGWIKMSFNTEVGLGPGHIVLDGDPASHGKGHSNPTFQPMSIVAKRSPISATAKVLSV